MIKDHQIAIDEDAEKVSCCKRGDMAAFEALVHKHHKGLFAVAFRITGDYDDATEVVQESFLSAYRSLGEFRGESRFSTWITAITVNLSRNRLKQTRQMRIRQPYSLNTAMGQGDGGEIFLEPASDSPSPHELVEQRDMKEKVEECVEALPQEFKEVIVLRDMQDFSYDEIGKVLDIREGTVKSRLFRARDAVKECLKRALGDLF